MSLRPFRARCCSGTGNHTKTRTNERHQQNHEAVPSAPPGLTTPSGSSERLLAPSDRREKAKPLDAVARSPGAYKILFSGIPLFLLHFLTRTLPHRLRFNGQGIKVTHVHPRDLTLATSPSSPHSVPPLFAFPLSLFFLPLHVHSRVHPRPRSRFPLQYFPSTTSPTQRLSSFFTSRESPNTLSVVPKEQKSYANSNVSLVFPHCTRQQTQDILTINTIALTKGLAWPLRHHAGPTCLRNSRICLQARWCLSPSVGLRHLDHHCVWQRGYCC